MSHQQGHLNVATGTAQAPQPVAVPVPVQFVPGAGLPVFPWQSWPLSQQWVQVPMIPQIHSGPQPTLGGNASGWAALAAVLQSRQSEHTPVGSREDDEEVLMRALKNGRAKGLSARQVLDGLHDANQHTATGWKDYFLDHLDRLYPKVAQMPDLRTTAGTSHRQPLESSLARRLDGLGHSQ
ncbi:hypothetical protein C8Q80DRAFT_530249 [Daedaleopsis nitida]|nr:hypothetical protein C8Q80DRAFT_530249 [Daedaleopsis nitida]